VLSEQGKADWEALAATRLFAEWTTAGKLIGTRPPEPGRPAVLTHDRIPFWSYPYEWSFSMLKEAAILHLDLLEAALDEGLTLKDATPYNIQFRGVSPVFIDIGSFRKYREAEPWLGYGQFCRQFLYPLLVRAHGGIPFQPLLRGSLAGITPAQARSMLGGTRLLRPGVMIDVVMHARAERAMSARPRDLRGELEAAGFTPEMIKANLRRLRSVVTGTTWRSDVSTWSEYASCDHVASQRRLKEEFIRAVVAERPRRLVWDLGANDGHFSRLAAANAEWVVAADADELVVDRLFSSLRSEGPSNVLPMVFDLSDPSPGLGWRGRERRPIEERARPDLVLALAVIHHLVISANLPLAEVVDWLGAMGAEIVLEWVPPEDPMAQRLAINKREGEIHPDYTEAALRRLIEDRFVLRAEAHLEGRRLFHLVPIR
jgi:hypothetical protein